MSVLGFNDGVGVVVVVVVVFVVQVDSADAISLSAGAGTRRQRHRLKIAGTTLLGHRHTKTNRHVGALISIRRLNACCTP